MADYLKGIFGGASSASVPVPSEDAGTSFHVSGQPPSLTPPKLLSIQSTAID